MHATPTASEPLGGTNDVAEMAAGISVGDIEVNTGFYILNFTCNATDELLLNTDLGLDVQLYFEDADSGQWS